MITATVINYTPGNYGPLQHVTGHRTFSGIEELSLYIKNIDSVRRRTGAHHIVLDDDVKLAVQVSGYNRRRGAFADVVPLAELQPYLDK